MQIPFETIMKEILKREKTIWRMEQKINKMKIGYAKHHKELVKEYSEEILKEKEKSDELKKDNASLALALLHENEIIENTFKMIENKQPLNEIEDFIAKAWVPRTAAEIKELSDKLKEL